MKLKRFLKQFNWRFLLVRILMNAIALAITAAVTPRIYFVDKSVWCWLLMAFMLGVLNALLKPILQFLTLPFIFVTYGLVVVLVNSLLLWLLSAIFPNRFAVEGLLWALVGGLVLGLVSSFLESLLGLTMPIVPEEQVELRRLVQEEARGIGRFVTSRRETALEEPALAIEGQAQEASATLPAAAAPAVAGVPALATDEGSPPPEDEAESSDSPVSADADSGLEPTEQQEEDRS